MVTQVEDLAARQDICRGLPLFMQKSLDPVQEQAHLANGFRELPIGFFQTGFQVIIGLFSVSQLCVEPVLPRASDKQPFLPVLHRNDTSPLKLHRY